MQQPLEGIVRFVAPTKSGVMVEFGDDTTSHIFTMPDGGAAVGYQNTLLGNRVRCEVYREVTSDSRGWSSTFTAKEMYRLTLLTGTFVGESFDSPTPVRTREMTDAVPEYLQEKAERDRSRRIGSARRDTDLSDRGYPHLDDDVEV
jgi:hypothetical protein